MDNFLPLLTFVIVATFTPGPNNVMVLASGANWGLARTMPHILGIALGFPVMILSVGFGLDAAFRAFPILYEVLKWVAFAYMLYLAWRVANAGRPKLAEEGGRPLGLLGAAAFQWVNPKAWIMAIGAITTYTPQDGFVSNVLLIAALFALVNCPSVGLWTVAGSLLRSWLDNPRALRAFNIGMALLLVASLYPILVDTGLF